jgi:midasin
LVKKSYLQLCAIGKTKNNGNCARILTLYLRFTEIWVPSITSYEDLQQIIEERFTPKSLQGYSKPVLAFVEWFLNVQRGRRTVSLRDILSWVGFMNETVQMNLLGAPISFVHGACLVLLDGLGVGSSVSNENIARKLRVSCLQKLVGKTFC